MIKLPRVKDGFEYENNFYFVYKMSKLNIKRLLSDTQIKAFINPKKIF